MILVRNNNFTKSYQNYLFKTSIEDARAIFGGGTTEQWNFTLTNSVFRFCIFSLNKQALNTHYLYIHWKSFHETIAVSLIKHTRERHFFLLCSFRYVFIISKMLLRYVEWFLQILKSIFNKTKTFFPKSLRPVTKNVYL